MMARRGVLGVLASAGTFILSGCGAIISNYSYRYKMVVTVDTPQGERSGFAVHETQVTKNNFTFWGLDAERGMYLRGEAVAVDLPGGQTLFALLCDPALPQSVLDPDWKNDWVASAQVISRGDTPRGPLSMTLGKPKPVNMKSGYPMLVRFRDIKDPKTVQEVDPANLAASFGAGVRLKGITVEVTDENATTGIGKRLGWLRTLTTTLIPPPAREPGDRLPLLKDTKPIQRIGGTSFNSELYK
jgi:hypothetical protein